MRTVCFVAALAMVAASPSAASPLAAQRYTGPDGKLRVALAKQPFSPTGVSVGPTTMANGGIQQQLAAMGAVVRLEESALTPGESTEYGAWKKLGMALGHYADLVAANERDGYFTIGLLATCPSMPGLASGLQHSGPSREPIKIGMLWLDAHPDFNTPETTRSGSLGGMPVAIATGRALQNMRLDAQLDRLDKLVDKIYVHIDMDVLDPREVEGHVNKVPDGPSSEQLARLFEAIFARYPKASAIGFATIPPTDEGGLSIAALNRMIAGAVRGVQARENRR